MAAPTPTVTPPPTATRDSLLTLREVPDKKVGTGQSVLTARSGDLPILKSLTTNVSRGEAWRSFVHPRTAWAPRSIRLGLLIVAATLGVAGCGHSKQYHAGFDVGVLSTQNALVGTPIARIKDSCQSAEGLARLDGLGGSDFVKGCLDGYKSHEPKCVGPNPCEHYADPPTPAASPTSDPSNSPATSLETPTDTLPPSPTRDPQIDRLQAVARARSYQAGPFSVRFSDISASAESTSISVSADVSTTDSSIHQLVVTVALLDGSGHQVADATLADVIDPGIPQAITASGNVAPGADPTSWVALRVSGRAGPPP